MPSLPGVSPCQLLGRGPAHYHLRVFGCACYPNTSATAPHKLSPRSTRCLFLGYSPDHKGYRCLDLTSHRIIISRHVVFDEDVFPLAGSTPPTDLDSLLESDPIPLPPPAPRLAPLPAPRVATTPPRTTSSAPRAAPSTPPAPRAATTIMPAPRAATSTTPAPRAAPSTPPAPHAAPSTPARFANPALVYHRRGHATSSAHPDSGPSTSAARFADPAVVYHRREPTIPDALDVPAVRSESSIYHPVAIHRDPGHVHLGLETSRAELGSARWNSEPSQARLGHFASSVMRLGSARYRLASRLGSAREPVHSSTQQQ
jgi:hypothetical protein